MEMVTRRCLDTPLLILIMHECYYVCTGNFTAVGRGRAGRTDHDQQHCYHLVPSGKPDAAAAVDRLLMMGKRMPETC